MVWENNTRRNSVAIIKQRVENKEVSRIDWVETSAMLADTLTKRGKNGRWLTDVISNNILKCSRN